MIEVTNMVIKNDAFYNETIVNSLITETVEAVAHGNTKAATKRKSVIDAVFTDKAKADTIFYKQDNGNSINYLWQIAVVSNILATRMEAELTDIVAFILEASLLSDLHHPNYIYNESKKNIDISQLFGHNFQKHIDKYPFWIHSAELFNRHAIRTAFRKQKRFEPHHIKVFAPNGVC